MQAHDWCQPAQIPTSHLLVHALYGTVNKIGNLCSLNVKSANIITAKRVLTELTRPEGRDCARRSPSVRKRIKGEVPGTKMSAVKFKRIAKAEAKCLRL